VNGGPGYAIWDIFRQSDSRKIRDFLDRKFITSRTHARERMLDPIHSQRYYLDSKLLTELREAHGIKSYRIYQEPGQAVFIPAGCAHQVCPLLIYVPR
jgi:lysine-specific demethylase 3